jgi:hypothetical protein
MGFEFRDERAGSEGVFDEWEKTGDEQEMGEMGTFLVSRSAGKRGRTCFRYVPFC